LLLGNDDNKVKLTLSRDIACFHSHVLHAAFKGNFAESQTLDYRLAHINEATGKFLLQWLYYHKLEILRLDEKCQSNPDYEEWAVNERKSLIALWALGDELAISGLQNEAIEIFHTIHVKHKIVCESAICCIYLLTAEDSTFRKYIVQFCAINLGFDVFKKLPNVFCKEFLLDYATFWTKFPRYIQLSDHPT
jgi:hypothetical protein